MSHFEFITRGAGVLLALAVPSAGTSAKENPVTTKAHPARGLRLHDGRAFDGYTLIAPMTSTRTILLDKEGRVVHEWRSDLPPGNAVYLQNDGSLLRCARLRRVPAHGGCGGLVQRLAWDSSLIWSFSWADSTRLHHHDIQPMPNGNILLISWEKKSRAEALRAGFRPALLTEADILPDAIFEIEPEGSTGGKVVWEWHAWDHLIQDLDPKCDNYGEVAAHPERINANTNRIAVQANRADTQAEEERMRQTGYLGEAGTASNRETTMDRDADWMHTNSIDYDPIRDLIVLSVCRFNEAWVIDHSTTIEEARGRSGGKSGRGGDLLYRYGNPAAYGKGTEADRRLFSQHDVQWINAGLPGAGNLLVFNNGMGRAAGAFSTVEEISFPPNPALPAVWCYGARESERFYSSFISGAQRLPNGNTLICSGEQGRVFEVTTDGTVVWEYLNEHGGDDAEGSKLTRTLGRFALFRATRIAKSHPGLAALNDGKGR